MIILPYLSLNISVVFCP